MKRLLLLVLLCSTGCIKSYIVEVSAAEADAHYVLVQTGQGGQSKVFDCVSRPDGKTWDPTCVKARMLSGPPGTEE